MWASIKKVVEKLTNFNLVLAGISLSFMAGLVFIEVMSRSLLNRSTLIADEMAGYLNVAIAFFGLAYTFRSNGFIKITILYNRFSSKWKGIVDVVSIVLSIAFSLTLFYYICGTVFQSYTSQATSVYISETPLYIPQLVMVVGIAFLMLQNVVELVEYIRKRIQNKMGSD
ncbi:TRAP transporter small permease [Lentibacillus sp. N15]|uniref:TRAP transporter small permease subunit n=1 Tax=Lentibacillus songyuanensis TaxID=3136161 RepID=UPI0031B9C369